jgi:PilZ domain
MRRERRKNFRVEWNSPATIYGLDRHSPRHCILSNFSNGGAKISGVRASTIPDEFKVRIPHGHGRSRKCRVIWHSDDTLGIEFTDRIKSAKKPNLKQTAREPVP